MVLHVFDNKELLSDNLAEWICDQAKATLQLRQYFSIVLSGGSTPKILYEKLASEKYKNQIDWNRVHVFWGDERVVPFSDERNNAKMAFDTLLNHVDIPKEQVHIMRTDIEPNIAAKEYAEMLRSFFQNKDFTFDLVLLGMGDDGHTLSLFPHSLILQDQSESVKAVYNEQQEMYRITLMPDIVNKSREIAFMVDGEKKAVTLQKVLEGPYQPSEFPSQLISPKKGELHWYLDKEAAKNLKQG
jgi:6-phosphogluconolactonase